MPSNCQFHLNRPNGVYYVKKDVVSGIILLSTTSEKKIESISVQFTGGSKCEFDARVSEDYKLSSKHIFVNERKIVREKGVLKPGIYTWSFSFLLSSASYTSLESQYGHIRYQLSLKITNQGKKYENIFVKPITVIKTFDLNSNSSFITTQRTEIKATCIFNLVRCRLYYIMSTRHSGYAPGQILTYAFHVYHKPLRKIECFKIKFFKKTTCHILGPPACKQTFKTILYEERVPDNGIYVQSHVGFFCIQSIAPTTFAKNLSVEYFLVVESQAWKSSSEVEVMLPIVIGTIPVRLSLTTHQSTWVEPYLVTRSNGRRSLKYKITPPRHERAYRYEPAFIDSTELAINRVDDFLPTYPMYNSPVEDEEEETYI